MKCDKLTPQEIADRHDCYVTVDKRGTWFAWEHRPIRIAAVWVAEGEQWRLNGLYDVQWQGDWKDSLHEPIPQLLPCPNGHEAHMVRGVPHAYCVNEYGATECQLTLPPGSSPCDLATAWNAMVTALKEARDE